MARITKRTEHSHRLDPLLAPRSLALIGASQRPNFPGNDMVRMAKLAGFQGRLYPVNPRYEEIEGLSCYGAVSNLPEVVDHAVIAVPNERLESVVAEVIEHGVCAMTIFASGHLADDPDLPGRIAARAREAGAAICGINAMGFANPTIGLVVAAFPAPADLRPGPVAFVSQSGSVFGALAYNDRRLKFSLCASSGSETVTTVSDYLGWALARPDTRVLGVFLESVRDPAGFETVLSESVRRDIPVVVLKTGRTPESAAVARSHTGAVAGNDAAYEALFAHYGVVRVHTVDELAATLLLFSEPRRAATGGLASIHDSGGECELLIDLAADLGVPLARIADATRAHLRANLDPGLRPGNPLDAWGTGRDAVSQFEACLTALMADPDTAAGLVVSDMRHGHYHHENLARVARIVHGRTAKPLAFANNYGMVLNERPALELTEARVPVIDGLPEALSAMGHLMAYRDFRRSPRHTRTVLPPHPSAQQWKSRLRDCSEVTVDLAFALLEDFGIAVAPWRVARTGREAVAAARTIGFPVALKTAATGIDHRSDVGGVLLDLRSGAAVVRGWRELRSRFRAEVLVAGMADPGVEIALGAIHDAQFGPVVMLAAGGVWVELLTDRAVALAPVDTESARALLNRLRIAKRLHGARGTAPVDLDSLARTAAALSRLAWDLRDLISQIDVNPVIAGPGGCAAVDALIVLAARNGSDHHAVIEAEN